jgi:hypothetical protein
MPRAFDSGDGGGRSGEARRIAARPTRSSSRTERSPDFSPTDRVTFAVETGTRPALILSLRSRWVTAGDERTCPVCAPLHGQIFREGEGPFPPLHRSCRCQRVDAGRTSPRGGDKPSPPAPSPVPTGEGK